MSGASWPSPSHNSRSVTDSEYSHLAPWLADGLFPAATDAVYADSSGMQVHVRASRYGIVQGRAWTSGSTETSLTIAANSSGLNRVDTVVLRLDRSTWDVTAAVRQGTPGAGAPTLQRDPGDTGMWEIPLADVAVDNGVASIAGSKVIPRPLLQSAAIRPCRVISDVQSFLAVGDLVYETSTGKWIAWTPSGGVVVYQDTGWLSLTLSNSAWTSSVSCVGRAIGGFATLRIGVQRVSLTFTKSDPDGSLLLTLPGPLRPAFSQFSIVQFSSGVATARVDVSATDGTVSFQHNSADITPGHTADFTITYALG